MRLSLGMHLFVLMTTFLHSAELFYNWIILTICKKIYHISEYEKSYYLQDSYAQEILISKMVFSILCVSLSWSGV